MDIEETISKAKQLRQDDELESSQELLLQLLEEYPDDPLVLFEVGGSYDVMGEEPQAIPYYRQAIDEGLDGQELEECLVCLGSSYRNVGRFDDSVELLEEAWAAHPDNNSIGAFLALAYYSNEQCEESVQLLLSLLLKTTTDDNILAYADAIDFYKDNLNEVWDD